jgi:hypothetical protein
MRIEIAHPVREAIGKALRRAIPLVEHDAEERAEQHELRKLEIKERVQR